LNAQVILALLVLNLQSSLMITIEQRSIKSGQKVYENEHFRRMVV